MSGVPPEQDVGAQAAVAAARTIWEQYREAVVARISVIERALRALRSGQLDEDLRGRAEREAHKLAGSLGTFGFADGSRTAREIELMLEPGARPAQAPELARLGQRLREELDGEPGDALGEIAARRVEHRPRLLVVDDDVELAERLAAEAATRGMRAEIATSPREALAAERPDVVLLDLNFPGGTAEAYEALSELSQSSPPVPVLVLTVSDAFTDRVEVARRGGRGFLPKTMPAGQVVDAVARFLDRSRAAETRVFAVDDDELLLERVRALLERQGLVVTTLADPLRFWQVLEDAAPDLLVLDVDMPHLSGIELCRVLRNDPRWSGLPVLFLTRSTDIQTVQSVFAAGADDYVAKPIVERELAVRIANRLERIRLYRALAENDTLTGIANRWNSSERLAQLARLADRFDEPLCLAEIDLDHFKEVNDRYGHATGDRALRRLGRLLRETFRGEDVIGRWGGEEFIVGLYGMRREDGVQRVVDLLEAFRAEELGTPEQPLRMTFSAGVAQYPDDGADVHSLYLAADEALYEAKAAGRNRVLPVGWRPAAPGEPVDVVVVEQDETLAELLLRALETRAYRTRWVRDAGAAPEALASDGAPSLVLLDVDMHGIDGLEVLRRIADAGALARSRVIVLSGEAEADGTLVRGLGADLVAKPFRVRDLMEHVRRAVGP